jgi:hypothetical protein
MGLIGLMGPLGRMWRPVFRREELTVKSVFEKYVG